MSEWYYSDAQRQQQGPVSASDLAALHARGLLPPETLVWREGMSAWRPWREMIREVVAGGSPGDAQAEAFVKAAEAAPADGAYRPYAIAEPTPYAPPQANVEAVAAAVQGGRVVHAGFWKRFAAYFIDYFAVTILSYALLIPLGIVAGIGFGASASADDPFASGAGIAFVGLMYVIMLVMPMLYFAGMHASRHQATLGKMAIGIKVTGGNGDRISFWRALGRMFATFLSSIILGIGYLMAGFTERKQALHDMVCDTLVVDKYAYTDHPEWQRDELGTVTIVVLALAGLMILGMLAALGMMFAVIAGGVH